jgi:hypothetical protein
VHHRGGRGLEDAQRLLERAIQIAAMPPPATLVLERVA